MRDRYNYKIGLYRIILVILVMIGHSAITTSLTYKMNVLDQGQYETMAGLFDIIYQFHMPAFLLLTGFLYRRYGRNYDFKKYQNKLLRFGLYIVVFQIIVFWAELIRNSSSQYIKMSLNQPIAILEYVVNALLFQSHMWYLQCYILCYLAQKLFEKIQKTYWDEILLQIQFIAFVAICINRQNYEINLPRVMDTVFYNIMWFYAGTISEKYSIHRKIKRNTLTVQAVFLIWVFQTVLYQPILHQIQGIFGQISLYYFVEYILNHKNDSRFKQIIMNIDHCGLTIYIWGFVACMWYQALWIVLSLKSDNTLNWDSTSIITYFLGSLAVQIVQVYIIQKLINILNDRKAARLSKVSRVERNA